MTWGKSLAAASNLGAETESCEARRVCASLSWGSVAQNGSALWMKNTSIRPDGSVVNTSPTVRVTLDGSGNDEFSREQQAFLDRHEAVHRRSERIHDEIQRLQSVRSLARAEKRALRKAEPLYRSMVEGLVKMRSLTDHIPEEEQAAQAVMKQIEGVMDSLEDIESRLEELLDLS